MVTLQPATKKRFAGITVDIANRKLWVGGKEKKIHPKPLSVLIYFAEHPNRLITLPDLRGAVWGDQVTENRTIRRAISRARKAMGESRSLLVTRRGEGYELGVRVTETRGDDSEMPTENTNQTSRRDFLATLSAAPIEMMGMPLGTPPEKELPLVLAGISATLRQGYGITQATRGIRPEVWVRETTLILGCHPGGPAKEKERTCAEWAFQVPCSIWPKARDARLVICCDRIHGGLHSPKKGSEARLFVNNCQLELLPLKVIPPGYTDYHHRESHPDLSTVALLKNCNTKYAFNVPLSFFKKDGTEVIQIQVAPKVYWDIDYVALIITHTEC